MTTQELAYEVISRLKKEYPDADCTLDYDDAWKLLVSVRLAAQCTDARVNVVVQDLYAKYPDVAALAAAEPEAIEAIVRPCGLGRSKARDISACMRMLRDEFGGHVPDTMEQLLRLPGVGRKTANVVMSCAFGADAIAVDTHVFRVANRLGLADAPDVLKTEHQLMQNIPQSQWSRAHHWLIYHGRRVCAARKPACESCTLRAWCEYANGNPKGKK